MTTRSYRSLTETIIAAIAASPRHGTELGSADGGIAADGEARMRCISFRDYMDMCLYDDRFGYYRSGAVRIGKDADFYTSSAIGDVLGQVIARYAWSYLERLPRRGRKLRLAEWGAGTGRLSAQIAAAGSRLSAEWPARVAPLLIEDHPAHAAEAGEQFRRAGAACEPAVVASPDVWREPERWLAGPLLLVANELLDAFPVHRVKRIGGALRELGVAWKADVGFCEVAMKPTRPELEQSLLQDGVALREGQETEICLDARDWLERLYAVAGEGRIMLIDYGHEAEEYRAEHRMAGTLMTYRRHRAGWSPYEHPGEQDLTAHVDFSFVRRAARAAGFEVAYEGSQLQFLLDHGVLELLSEHDGRDPFGEAARRNRAVRQLLLSDGMSETFKVMILEKR